MKIQHALVPLDHSKLAEVALDYARSVVAPGGQITLLLVVETHGLVGINMYASMSANAPAAVMLDTEVKADSDLRQSAWEAARQYLDTIAARLTSQGYTVETRLEEGSPAESILDAAEEMQADAIVMSTHGRSGLSRWVMGSVAQKVLSAATCPVFLVPQRSLAHSKIEREASAGSKR